MPRTAIRLSPDPSASAMLADEFAAHLVDRLGQAFERRAGVERGMLP